MICEDCKYYKLEQGFYAICYAQNNIEKCKDFTPLKKSKEKENND